MANKLITRSVVLLLLFLGFFWSSCTTAPGPPKQTFMCKCCLIPMTVQSIDEICSVCQCGHKARDCK